MKTGANVRIILANGHTQWLFNVTETHYNFRQNDQTEIPRIAFESDVHNTGVLFDMGDITEFEGKATDVVADLFYGENNG